MQKIKERAHHLLEGVGFFWGKIWRVVLLVRHFGCGGYINGRHKLVGVVLRYVWCGVMELMEVFIDLYNNGDV